MLTRALLATTLLSAVALVQAAPACTARSGELATALVELYTSEGCSSCPPADRWLSSQGARPGVVTVAWHVDYWDRLGWRDRFASADATARQVGQLRVNGSRFAYTPQVVVDGRDRPDWPRLVPAAARPSVIDIRLQREGGVVNADVRLRDGAAPVRVAGWWALLEDGHRTVVRAGENDGATLHHDGVARARADLEPWAAGEQLRRLSWRPPGCSADARSCRVALVVVEADSQRPLQALSLGC